MRPVRLLTLLPLLWLNSCTFHRPTLVAPANIGPKETAVSVDTGKSTAFMILFFGPFGDDSLEAAVKDAKLKHRADSMLNVFVDRETFLIPLLYMQRTTSVYGTLIRYVEKLEPEAERSVGTPTCEGKLSASRFVGCVSIGNQLKVYMTDGRVYQGRLTRVDPEVLVLGSEKYLLQNIEAVEIVRISPARIKSDSEKPAENPSPSLKSSETF